MNNLWTGPQVAQIVGMTYDTLNYWLNKEIFSPCIQASKPRERSYYSFSDIVAIAAIKALRDSGISLQKIRRAGKELQQKIGINIEQGLQGGVVVADNNKILAVLYTFDEAIQIMSLLEGGQMVLPLDNIVSEVEQRVEHLFGETIVSMKTRVSEKV